jgi:flagellar hook protein FlgE
MWDGVSGLRTHQQRMDVIGNDIANVNTVGYKESDVTFKEQLVNTLQPPAARTLGKQVGMGVMMGSISRNFKDGVLMETQRSGNLAIGGDGFFQVQDRGGNLHYSRAGDFQLITDGNNPAENLYLANANGDYLCDGAGNPVDFPAGITEFSIGVDGTVTYIDDAGVPVVDGQIETARFDNPAGLMSIGHNLYDVVPEASGPAQFAAPGQPGHGELYQGYLENSNVDLAKEFTNMIITQRGFQANSRSITTGDEMLQEIMMLKR